MHKILLSISLVSIGVLIAGSILAEIDPQDVLTGHVWLFDDVKGNTVEDDSGNPAKVNCSIAGAPESVEGINGNALKFDGISDGINVPNANSINLAAFPSETVKVIFNCADVSKSDKQNIWEEGGDVRGVCIYVFEDELYVGAWNRAEYNWNGEWISAPIESNRWYEVALILRDTKQEVEDDKFEMWLDGRLVEKRPGGQVLAHSQANTIGFIGGVTVFHDGGSAGACHFEGMIDEVWLINEATDPGELKSAQFVKPTGKLVDTWGAIKCALE